MEMDGERERLGGGGFRDQYEKTDKANKTVVCSV